MGFNTNKVYKVHFLRQINESVFVIRFDRHGMNFIPGQHILIGLDEKSMREYSVYSAVQDDFLEVLVKAVPDGSVSKRLKMLDKGDMILVESAVGFFRIRHNELDKKYLFIASGTGISPFHSMVKSYPELNYLLLHGIPHIGESYDANEYEPGRLIRCTSKSDKGEFNGRVTQWLEENNVDDDLQVFLCGNSNMILDARDILLKKNFPAENINTEVYF